MGKWEKIAAGPDELAYKLRNGASVYTLVLHQDRAFATLYAGEDQDGIGVAHEQIQGSDGIVQMLIANDFPPHVADEIAVAIIEDAGDAWLRGH